MSSYLINFAKTGNPNGKDLLEWPLNSDNKTLLNFDENIGVIDEKMLDLYAVFDEFYGF